jgi:class I fructose-bisphosphate aldolase
MHITDNVKKILENYGSDNPGTRSKLYNILMHGKLAGTGKMVILPVDQGFEHGPSRSFAKNPDAFDPDYHFKLAIEAGLSAYAAPLGFLEASIDKFCGQIPTILKLNNNNSLTPKAESANLAITSSVKDALRLGCSAVGFTIYPGSNKALEMIEEAREIIQEAKLSGLPTVIWSYPRGGDISKEGETAIDICEYGAHIVSLLGAHIIKVKLPTPYLENNEAKKIYESEKIQYDTLTKRVSRIVQSCFNGKRLVVFSGGVTKTEGDLLDEVKAIKNGNGNGSIIGRNVFQRPYKEAMKLLEAICTIYNN